MHKIIAFVGPSRSGKSTLIRGLAELYPDRVCELKSLTTRPRRGPEDDATFDFTTPEEFKRLIAEKRLVQWVEYAENFYGNDRDVLDAQLQNRHGLLAMTEHGVKNFTEAQYTLFVIRVVPVGYTPTHVAARRAEDLLRSSAAIPVNFSLANYFCPGGLDRTKKSLAALLRLCGYV